MSTGRGKMRTLVGMLMALVVSGDDIVRVNVTGFIGGDALLPCTCLDRDFNKEFRWQTEGKIRVPVVKHTGNTSDFSDNYSGRAKLFLSENSSNCSILLKNITLEDKRKYKCSFKDGGGVYNYSYVNLTVSERDTGTMDGITGPGKPTSPGHIRTLCRVMPVALVVVLSLFLFYYRKVSGWLNVGEEKREPRISV